jgi:Glycosyl hydrolases family 2, TIM barrel domain
VLDQVSSYFGMRKVEIKKDLTSRERIFLNGEYTYNLGVLDQGFWPDGLYTAPTDGALKFDIQAAKAMGFNAIRKHIKLEPDRWYYYCDKLGMLVWQDMVPPGNDSRRAHVEFEREIEATLRQLQSHPSIIAWVLFNEGWGAYDQSRLSDWMRSIDPTRLIDAHSGANVPHLSEWERHLDPSSLSKVINGDAALLVAELVKGGTDPENWVGSDMTDMHVYPGPALPPAEAGRVRVLGEHGGYGIFVENHIWNSATGFGYEDTAPGAATRTYSQLVDKLKEFEAEGLSASIYTQPFDVEQEQSGLMTYDRAVIKIPVEDMARINAKLVPRAANYIGSIQGFWAENLDTVPRAQRYAELLEKYKKGEREIAFLRRLIVMANLQQDLATAAQAINNLIERLPVPYSRDDWAFIAAATRSTRDKGFALLRDQMQQVDTFLGENAAEKMIRDAIGRDEVTPHLSADVSVSEWSSLERSISAKYGELGAERVYGAEMIYYLDKQDWGNFAKYYVLYYKSASERSEYSITDLSYALFQHVSDPSALEAATEACRTSLDSGEARGESNVSGIDTYANLLYKLGRHGQAIEWEERAERISEGRDPYIVEHLERMRSGEPTWSTG